MKSCFEMTKLINVHIHTYISWWEHFKSTQSSSIPHILWLTADAILCSRFPWTYSFHHYEILNALTNMCPTIPPLLPVHAMWLLHVREALWYLSSHDWFISLNIMSSSFIHEVTGNKVPSFFFLKLSSNLLWFGVFLYSFIRLWTSVIISGDIDMNTGV